MKDKLEKSELPELICGKTIEEIRAMRMTYGHLFVVTVKDEDSIHYAVCKEPTIQIIESSQAIAKTSEVKGAVTLYENCVVLADEDIKKRDMLKLQVAAAIGEKTNKLSVFAKNV
jgi:hypothetical protein